MGDNPLRGVSARDAGLSVAAALSECRHERREAVVLGTDETVAVLCSDCLLELPLAWL